MCLYKRLRVPSCSHMYKAERAKMPLSALLSSQLWARARMCECVCVRARGWVRAWLSSLAFIAATASAGTTRRFTTCRGGGGRLTTCSVCVGGYMEGESEPRDKG